MSSLLTSTDITNVTSVFAKHFDAFAAHSHIVVHKEPIKTLISSSYSGVNWAGFPGDSINEDNYSYQIQTGIFPCIVKDGNKPGNFNQLEDLKVSNLSKEQIIIKVERDAKDYIDSNKTLKLELNDGRVYNSFSLYSTQNYFGLMYYYYLLDRTT